MIPILHMPTMETNMSPSRERFLDNFPTVRAILARVLRRNRDCCHTVHFAEILHLTAKLTPGCITNRFSQVVILDHVTNLQVFQHHEVIRLHYAPCSFSCKVSTLALHFQMRFTQPLQRFTPILGTLHLLTSSAL